MTVAINEAPSRWEQLRFLTCSVLPVSRACNLKCPFCFSASSISALGRDKGDVRALDLERFFADSKRRGARRLVITGGGEPLLKFEVALEVVRRGAAFFDEIACFTNATTLTRPRAEALADAGLSYLAYSRHATGDDDNRALMGPLAPDLADVIEAAGPLKVRATCVMTRGAGGVETDDEVWAYIEALARLGVKEFTFKHTYTAYTHSVFKDSRQDTWARAHQVERDPFINQGEVLGTLPWGPQIRRIAGVQVCYYTEPTPRWELSSKIGRSTNLMADGSVFASLEDRRSLLYRL